MSVFQAAPAARSPTQYLGIDLMRFFAAVMVMLFHLLYLTSARQGSAYWMSSGQIHLQAAWPYTHGGWIGVQIFFVISGFVIALSAQGTTPRRFVASRAARLAPAVWVCAPLTFLLAAGLMHDYRTGGLLRSLFFVPFGPWVEVVYWTLGIELCFYALVLALIVFRRADWLDALAIVLGLVSTLFWVLYFDLDPRSGTLNAFAHSRWSELLLIQHGCQFAIGILLWHNLTAIPKEMRVRNYAFMAIFAVGSCLQIFQHHLREIALVDTVFGVTMPMAVWLVAVLFILWSTTLAQAPPGDVWYRKWFRQMGLVTYPLYLLHLSLGTYAMGFLAHRGLNSARAAVVSIVFLLAASWVIAVFIEPPLHKLTKSAFMKKANASSPPPATTPHRH